MCDLWWTKWHWDRFLPEYFGFPLSISFHRYSITWKNEKKIIFITGLHNKPQGCGASVASAAGPLKNISRGVETSLSHIFSEIHRRCTREICSWCLQYLLIMSDFPLRGSRLLWVREVALPSSLATQCLRGSYIQRPGPLGWGVRRGTDNLSPKNIVVSLETWRTGGQGPILRHTRHHVRFYTKLEWVSKF
jgi:hypothetical protein